MSKGKILVIRGGAIGDFILTLPVLSAVRETFPETGLEVLGYSHIAGLAKAGGLVDAVRSIEAQALAGFFARGGTLDHDLQEYFAGFSVIVSYLYDPDETFQNNLKRCSKAQYIPGAHRPMESEGMHATEVYLKALEKLAIFGANPVPLLKIGGREKRETLAVHPGSGSERKNWPLQKWRGLLQQLVTPREILLVGGEAEGDKLERLARELPPGRFEVARGLPLPVLAERLSECRVFVGHDSGISHLAAALGLPTLVLWGDTIEAVWRPLGEPVRILRAEKGLAALPVERVLEEVRRMINDEGKMKNEF